MAKLAWTSVAGQGVGCKMEKSKIANLQFVMIIQNFHLHEVQVGKEWNIKEQTIRAREDDSTYKVIAKRFTCMNFANSVERFIKYITHLAQANSWKINALKFTLDKNFIHIVNKWPNYYLITYNWPLFIMAILGMLEFIHWHFILYQEKKSCSFEEDLNIKCSQKEFKFNDPTQAMQIDFSLSVVMQITFPRRTQL